MRAKSRIFGIPNHKATMVDGRKRCKNGEGKGWRLDGTPRSVLSYLDQLDKCHLCVFYRYIVWISCLVIIWIYYMGLLNVFRWPGGSVFIYLIL